MARAVASIARHWRITDLNAGAQRRGEVSQTDFVGRIRGPHDEKKAQEYQEPRCLKLLNSSVFFSSRAEGAKSVPRSPCVPASLR